MGKKREAGKTSSFSANKAGMPPSHRRRQVVNLCAYGLLVFLLYHFFSPWKLVIEIRPASTLDEAAAAAVENASGTTPPVVEEQDEIKQNDFIESNFGGPEEAFLESIGQPSDRPPRSRDNSIKLIYDANTPSDWLDLIDGHDDHGLMALTKLAQHYIYDKQNPSSCKDRKFLILNKFPGDDYFGLGAIVQRITDYLSVAIQTNSILLYAEDLPPGEHFIQPPRLGGDSTCGRSFDCIFQKLSKCTSAAQSGLERTTQSVFASSAQRIETDLDVKAYLAKHGSPIPPVFEKGLRMVQPDITGEMLKYWWRAQAAAYLMRLNGNASKRLKELRLGKDVQQRGIQWDLQGEPQDVGLPFPMPEGTISMHVRHGDKGSEMRLVPFNDYVVRAEKFTMENPLGTWKRAFLSTEDPNVIEQMKIMPRITPFEYSGSNARWTWYWSEIPRLNTSPETQLKEFGNRTELTLKWILQLIMAIECDVFVGTRGSGWNRLIDSLRCVWLGSCKQPFLEVGIDNDWAGYGP